MNPAKVNMTIIQGSTLSRVFAWVAGGVAVDLTGYTGRMQIRETVDSTTVLLDLNTSNGGMALGGVAGTITLASTATVTAALSFDTAVYDIELVIGAAVTRVIEGKVKLSPEVTR